MKAKEARQTYFNKRNAEIKKAYDSGISIEALAIYYNRSLQRIKIITEHKKQIHKSYAVKAVTSATTRKLSLYDSKNADKMWEAALGQGAFN